MRVLGAKSEVIGDTSRSNPKPGEAVTLTWDMAYPDLKQDDSQLQSFFFTCTAPERFTGVPVCQELLDANQNMGGENLLEIYRVFRDRSLDCGNTPDMEIAAGSLSFVCVKDTPKLRIPIARNFDAAAKLVQGIICKQGTPVYAADEPSLFKCTPRPGVDPDDVESIPVYGTIQVERGPEEANHNPSIDAAHIRFGESENQWPTLSPEDEAELGDDCGSAARAQDIPSTNGKDEKIVIEYDADAREVFDGEPEILEFSTYTTWGELNRRFTVFAPTAKLPLRSELKWNLDQDLRDELGDRSRLVRFYFTLIDRRGGYAVTSRELCVGRDLTRAN